MNDDKNLIKSPHSVVMQGRNTLSVTGVNDIDSFDEQMVILYTTEGEMVVRGVNLHINKIDVNSGELSMEGDILGISYNDNISTKGSIFAKLFR